MKFIYFYSDIYEFYHNHLQKTLQDHFELSPIKIDDISTNPLGHTFSNGVSIKIELIIKSIEENMNMSIIFTDATIFINAKNTSQLETYIQQYNTPNIDLCFADNLGHDQYNIGFILIQCNEKTLAFFKKVLDELNTKKGWDQAVINQYLRDANDANVGTFSHLRVSKFDHRIHCGWSFNPLYKDSFYVFKSFIYHKNDKVANFNQRIDIFFKSGLINATEYNNTIIKENTQIPNI
jgi:hypothetical protein